MDTENFSLNNSSNTKIIEDLGAIFPRIGITILSDGLIIESIDCCDLSSFVVTSKESNVCGILKF